ncbi:MAG: DUF1214 domain-containing protein [Pseudomonadota bacterium]
MTRIIYWLSAIILGVVVGYQAFNVSVDAALYETGIENGPWRTNTAYGDRDADPMLKSGVALTGLMALKVSETVYFTAYNDDQGQPLSSACTYRISGAPLQSRWWSITIYGEDHYLIPNQLEKYSFFMPEDAAPFAFLVAPEEPQEELTWLPSTDGGLLSITLRLYNPESSIYENLETVQLPNIENEGCR